MDYREYRRLVKQYRAEARQRFADLKDRRRQRRGATITERLDARRAERVETRAWHAEVRSAAPRRERKARRKGYKAFRKRQHRWIKLTAMGVVVALIAGAPGSWYYTATRPATEDQASARTAPCKSPTRSWPRDWSCSRMRGTCFP